MTLDYKEIPQIFFIHSRELLAIQQIALKKEGYVIVITTPCGDEWNEQGIFVGDDEAQVQGALSDYGEDQKSQLLGFIAAHSKDVFADLKDCAEQGDKIEIVGKEISSDNFVNLIKSAESFAGNTQKAISIGGSEEWPMGLVYDKVFVFTGVLTISREKAVQLVEEYGGIVSSNLGKKTDYLVVGENPGSKLDRASKLGVQVLTSDEFFRLISEASGGDYDYE